MSTKSNELLLNSIETYCPILNEGITKGIEEYKEYLDSLKEEEFEEKKNETEEDSIKRAEGIIGGLDEMIKRNDSSNRRALETIEIIRTMIDLFRGIVIKTANEREGLENRTTEIIDKVIEIKRIHTNKLILQNPKRRDAIRNDFDFQKEIWEKKRIRMNRMPADLILEVEEMKQIEEWTNMKIGKVIFHSYSHNWREDYSVFDEIVLNRSNLVFIIKDEYGNKIGGYVNAKIDSYLHISDPKAFLFSLKSHGRLNGMMKFEIIDPKNAFQLEQERDGSLFVFGNDIGVQKEEIKVDHIGNNHYLTTMELKMLSLGTTV